MNHKRKDSITSRKYDMYPLSPSYSPNSPVMNKQSLWDINYPSMNPLYRIDPLALVSEVVVEVVAGDVAVDVAEVVAVVVSAAVVCAAVMQESLTGHPLI
eukprot:Platyproteum_vivax@DN252_c0_g1_i2.p3